MIHGQWKVATIASSGDTSGEVDLGADFRDVLVLIPALDDTEVTIHVNRKSGGTFFPLFALDDDATGDFAHATTTLTTAKAVIFRCGAQFIKMVVADSQTGGERTFYVRGIN